MATEQTPDEKAEPVQTPVPDNLEHLEDVSLTISLELGRTRITLDDALALGEQSALELNKIAGESIDILLNDKLFAHGEIVTVNEHFGVRITEIVSQV